MRCCEQQRERTAQPSKEPQRGVNSLDGKVKRNHLNTPTSWPPQEKLFIWSPFFQYNKRLLGQKWVGHACICPRMVLSLIHI